MSNVLDTEEDGNARFYMEMYRTGFLSTESLFIIYKDKNNRQITQTKDKKIKL